MCSRLPLLGAASGHAHWRATAHAVAGGHIKALVHGGRQAMPVAPERCEACGTCVQVCPEQAISLARRTGR